MNKQNFITALALVLIVAFCGAFIGCPEARNMMKPVVDEPKDEPEKPPTMVGEVKQSEAEEEAEPETEVSEEEPAEDPEPEEEPAPPLLTPELEYGVKHWKRGGSPQSDILPSSAWVTDFPGRYRRHEAPASDSEDFVGRVVMPVGGDNADDWAAEEYVAPVSDVIVTVTHGPRAGEQVLTDKGGYYIFKDVEGDELYVRVERQWLEPKEVIVHRCCGTILQQLRQNQVFALRDESPEVTPGTILMGLRWPDAVRPILEDETLPHDLLYIAATTTSRNLRTEGAYKEGVITSYDAPSSGRSERKVEMSYAILAHNLAHARQGADAMLHGVDELSWEETPQGEDYKAALRRDLARVRRRGGGLNLDDFHLYQDSVSENAAEFCAIYWLQGLNIWYRARVLHQDDIQEGAPNRYRWAKKYLDAHPTN